MLGPDWTLPVKITAHVRHRIRHRIDKDTLARWGTTREEIDAGAAAEIRAACALDRVSRYPPEWACESREPEGQLYLRTADDSRVWVIRVFRQAIVVVTVLERREPQGTEFRLRTGLVHS